MTVLSRLRRAAPGFLLCALALLTRTGPAYAATPADDTSVPYAEFSFVSSGTPEVVWDGVPFVMYENEVNHTPDLYVKKEVTADAGARIPDVDFRFLLKVKGKPYAEQKYRVLNEAGKEVFQVAGPDGITQKTDITESAPTVDFVTDEDGIFTLKAGQTAWFGYVGNGAQYNVEELGAVMPEDAEGSFRQVQPAGSASAIGTVDPDGTGTVFINKYYPKTEDAELTVIKEAAFFDGYELPEDTEFKFSIQVHNGRSLAAWANEPYMVGRDKRFTDASGQFTLKAGESAVFKNVPVADCKVAELPSESELGWHPIGESEFQGSTAQSDPVVFSNGFAAFAVRKRMEDYSLPSMTFAYTLTGGDGSVMADAKYYLYGSDKKLVDAAPKQTDTNGHFQLKAGETAVFFGIKSGTKYGVAEVPEAWFEQITPGGTAGGYLNQTVTDSGADLLQFVNAPADVTGLLVTKKVDAADGYLPQDDPDFKFVLMKKSGSTYSPVPNATYYVKKDNGEASYKTGADGSFTIKANQSAEFRYLAEGEYRVKEIDLPAGYKPESGHEDGWDAVLGSKGVNLVCTNKYTKAWNIAVSKEVGGELEGDAEFTEFDFTMKLTGDASELRSILWEKGTESGRLGEGGEGMPSISAEDVGSVTVAFKLSNAETVVFKGIPTGTEYTIEEAESDGFTPSVKIDGTDSEAEEKGTASGTVGKADVAVAYLNTYDGSALLPTTGGTGSAPVMMIGLLMVLAGAVTTVFAFRKGGKRS